MTTSCVCVVVFFAASVYVHVMVVSEVMGKLTMLLVTMTELMQLSVALGVATSFSLSKHYQKIYDRKILQFYYLISGSKFCDLSCKCKTILRSYKKV